MHLYWQRLYGLTVIRMRLIAIFLLVVALALPVSGSAPPAITAWSNNKTNNATLSLTVNISEFVRFNATADLTIDTWNWFKDDVYQSNNFDNFNTSFTAGAHTVKVSATNNTNGTSDTIAWSVTVPAIGGAPNVTSWGNNKTNNGSLNLTINTSEAVRFNATTNQTIDAWNWYKDDVNQPNNFDNLTTNFTAAGTHTIKVSATNNTNGTSTSITWTVTVQAPAGAIAPRILSWGNNKTNNSDLNLAINASETVKFNFTADQTLTSWLWKLNKNSLSNPSDTLTYTFNNKGLYRVAASGSNANGSTQTIDWNVTVKEKEGRKKNATLLTWFPQVVDYVYVNETVSETIEYSITTVEAMTMYNWSVDGRPVTGVVDGNTYSHIHTWDNKSVNDSVGFHTVIFRGSDGGSDADTKVEFRWYVNVYEIGTYRGRSLFDVIDDALENHVTDIKIRMFKYKIAKDSGKSAIAAQKVNLLHDEIAKRQMTREALREEFKAGNISIQNYTAALKQAQRDAKYNSILAKEYAKIAKEDLKDVEAGKKLEKLSEMEDDWSKAKKKVDEIEDKSKGKKVEDNKNKKKGND